MKRQKLQRKRDDPFAVSEAESHIFRASDVTQILGMEKWRLEKFLTGKQYQISPSGHIGSGKGSWRLFSHEDLYRLAIANQMVEDGFTAKFVNKILQDIEDSELLTLDEDGNTRATDVCVVRSDEGPHVAFPSAAQKKNVYYVLPLHQLISNVDKRIAERKVTR